MLQRHLGRQMTSRLQLGCSLTLTSCMSRVACYSPLAMRAVSGTFHGSGVNLQAGKPAEVSYKCSACGKSFRLQNALNHHIMTKHAGNATSMVVGKDGKQVDAAQAPSSNGVRPQPSAGPKVTPPGAATPSAASVAPLSQSPASQPKAPDQDDKKLFVCTVCQKTFRLEAALQHHYQAKHGMEMPGAAPSSEAVPQQPAPSSPTSVFSGSGGPSSFAAVAAAAASAASGDTTNSASFTRPSEVAVPQAYEYHLDAAPNAPEEGEIAAHWRCVNNGVLIGEVQEIQDGFVFEDKVLQFVVVTQFENPLPGDSDRDYHTVRVYGEEFTQHVKTLLTNGSRVMVTGRLRLVPQYEQSTNKFYHFPILIVQPGSGNVMQM